jgi:hypothetical protein
LILRVNSSLPHIRTPRSNVPSIRIGEAELYDNVAFAILRALGSPTFNGYRFAGSLAMINRRIEILLHRKALFARDAFANHPDGLLDFRLMPLVDEHRRIHHYNAKRNEDENQFRPVRKESSHITDPISKPNPQAFRQYAFHSADTALRGYPPKP